MGATGLHDPSAVGIRHRDLLGHFDQGLRFVHGAAGTAMSPGATGAFTSAGKTIEVHAGSSYAQQFSIAGGDKLDLTSVLAGAPIAHDLTNISQFVKVLGYGSNDPGYGLGTKTMLEVTGPSGSARIDLQGSGKLDLKDLLQHDSLVLPHR
jgi:hypothetical protein